MSAHIDTLSYAKRLIAVGVEQKQAEVQAEIFAEIVETNLVTKQDLKEAKAEITVDIVKWVAAMLLAQTGLIAALFKLFMK